SSEPVPPSDTSPSSIFRPGFWRRCGGINRWYNELMVPTATQTRQFIPGTMGWTAADLDDPEIERQWFAGRYEIVEGVLTIIPPAYFAGGEGLFNLLFFLKGYLNQQGSGARIATEVDIVID